MGVVATIEHWECTHHVSVIDYFERAPNVNSPKAKWTNFLSSPQTRNPGSTPGHTHPLKILDTRMKLQI